MAQAHQEDRLREEWKYAIIICTGLFVMTIGMLLMPGSSAANLVSLGLVCCKYFEQWYNA